MKKREIWLDVLRVLAAFLVIVNHTNSDVFQSVTPENGTWWLSIAWYALCKLAVPVFVMVSGSVLLGREDSYRKCFSRLGRIIAVMLVFSYLYFLHNAWVNHGLWPRALRLDIFIGKVWSMNITNSFWYLYFYAGLLLMLPLLQRLSCAMTDRDARYLIGLCFGLGAGWQLLAHFVPAISLPRFFSVPELSTMIGLFFSGWQLRKARKPLHSMPWLIGLTTSVLISVILLYGHYVYMQGEGKYWLFMDDCMKPSLPVTISAICAFQMIRCLFDRPMSEKRQLLWTELGGCAFTIYLLQDWVIAESEFRVFMPLCKLLPAFPAVILWESLVFLLCLMGAMVLRRIPGIKKII